MVSQTIHGSLPAPVTRVHIGGRALRWLFVQRVEDVCKLVLELLHPGLVPLEVAVVVEVDEDDGGDDEADPDEEEGAAGGADDDGQGNAGALRPLRPGAVIQLLLQGGAVSRSLHIYIQYTTRCSFCLQTWVGLT